MKPWGNNDLSQPIHLNLESSWGECNHLLLKQGILYRQARPRESEETLFQLVLLATQREVALKGCHDEVGHLGQECMLNLLHDRFYWPFMAAQAKEHIGKCLDFKIKQPKASPENIVAMHPLELVHLDYLCLEPGKGLEENVWVVTDHFIRYTQAYVTRTQTVQTTARTLWHKFIVHYGLLGEIPSDQGHNFESQLVAGLCKLVGMQKIQTSPYHPQTNDQCERFNSTLINMLGMLPQRRSQSGRTTLECWSMLITALDTQLQGSAPTISCTGDNPVLQ